MISKLIRSIKTKIDERNRRAKEKAEERRKWIEYHNHLISDAREFIDNNYSPIGDTKLMHYADENTFRSNLESFLENGLLPKDKTGVNGVFNSSYFPNKVSLSADGLGMGAYCMGFIVPFDYVKENTGKFCIPYRIPFRYNPEYLSPEFNFEYVDKSCGPYIEAGVKTFLTQEPYYDGEVLADNIPWKAISGIRVPEKLYPFVRECMEEILKKDPSKTKPIYSSKVVGAIETEDSYTPGTFVEERVWP